MSFICVFLCLVDNIFLDPFLRMLRLAAKIMKNGLQGVNKGAPYPYSAKSNTTVAKTSGPSYKGKGFTIGHLG